MASPPPPAAQLPSYIDRRMFATQGQDVTRVTKITTRCWKQQGLLSWRKQGALSLQPIGLTTGLSCIRATPFLHWERRTMVGLEGAMLALYWAEQPASVDRLQAAGRTGLRVCLLCLRT